MVIWDNLNTHRSAAMREFDRGPGLAACHPVTAYAPDLNPVEHVWSQIKRGLGNLLVWGIDELVTVVKNRLKRIQYRPELIDAFFAHTGLDLEPP